MYILDEKALVKVVKDWGKIITQLVFKNDTFRISFIIF